MDYTGNNGSNGTASQSLPLVVQVVADGEERDASSIDPAVEQLTDIASAYIEFGMKRDESATVAASFSFGGTQAFTGGVDMHAATSTRYRAPSYISSPSADQTLDPATAEHFVVNGALPGSAIFRLATTGVSDGMRIRVAFLVSVGSGAVKFRRGADNAHEICTLDNATSGDVLGTVGFQRVAGVWRLTEPTVWTTPGTYA